MSFPPYPTRSGIISLGVAVLAGTATIVLLDLLLKSLLQQAEPPLIFRILAGLLITVMLTALALCWTIVAFKLSYRITRNGLAIRWGLSQQLVPFNDIEAIISGGNIAAEPTFRGINIAGLRFGWGNLMGFERLKVRATAPLAHCLLIVTQSDSYIISPRQPDTFVKAWQVRQELGPTQQWTSQLRRPGLLNVPLMVDPLTWWLLGLAAGIGFGLLGYISLQYATFPDTLPIHFSGLVEPDCFAHKSALFLLPAVGAAVWASNAILGILIYNREQLGAYLLWGSTILMQLCLWIAALSLIT